MGPSWHNHRNEWNSTHTPFRQVIFPQGFWHIHAFPLLLKNMSYVFVMKPPNHTLNQLHIILNDHCFEPNYNRKFITSCKKRTDTKTSGVTLNSPIKFILNFIIFFSSKKIGGACQFLTFYLISMLLVLRRYMHYLY